MHVHASRIILDSMKVQRYSELLLMIFKMLYMPRDGRSLQIYTRWCNLASAAVRSWHSVHYPHVGTSMSDRRNNPYL
jgi:hypothetical protein